MSAHDTTSLYPVNNYNSDSSSYKGSIISSGAGSGIKTRACAEGICIVCHTLFDCLVYVVVLYAIKVVF